MNCPICNSNNIKLVLENHPGYIDDIFYNIYKCNKCDVSFINPKLIEQGIYSIIYSNKESIGYDRYYKYANEIKKVDNPLKYLSEMESCYYPVFKVLSERKKCSILEVGCGYGYLTYALKKADFDVLGIDISSEAIEFAKSNFGNSYLNISIEDYFNICKNKYDIIISTEVIEHLPDPNKYLKILSNMLSLHGKIIITTPNKNYSKRKLIWRTDLPPVHIYWFSKMSVEIMAKNLNLEINYIPFNKYYPKRENKIVKFIRFQFNQKITPFFTKQNELNRKHKANPNNFLRSFIKWLFHNYLIRNISNLLFNLISSEDNIMAIVFFKKNENK